ncbi:hypothetical protein VAE063_20003 [Vibrio aestuarianus]|uniref:Uncharacterized protein n=1 Tax=Vibrio aestuarianus TaxID=28171 RepID=A0ABM9FKV5_9VIBR|nr:hypothetical protein VAE063_20003 [Vibrio aestuarianus]
MLNLDFKAMTSHPSHWLDSNIVEPIFMRAHKPKASTHLPRMGHSTFLPLDL